MIKTEKVRGIPVYRFDSPAEFATAAAQHAGGNDGWTGSTVEQAVNACVHGDLTSVVEAESIMDKIQAAVDTHAAEWTASPCGAYPVVPEYLAGRFDSMRRRIRSAKDTAPIRIYLDLTSSGGIDHPALTKRGIAFLALAMLLAQKRPVEMHVLTALGGRNNGIVTIKMPTAPLDTAIAAGVFTLGIARTLGYPFLNEVAHTGGHWLCGIYPDGTGSGYAAAGGMSAYMRKLRDSLDAGPDDMVIGPAFLYDDSIREPIRFVQNMIDQSMEINANES